MLCVYAPMLGEYAMVHGGSPLLRYGYSMLPCEYGISVCANVIVRCVCRILLCGYAVLLGVLCYTHFCKLLPPLDLCAWTVVLLGRGKAMGNVDWPDSFSGGGQSRYGAVGGGGMDRGQRYKGEFEGNQKILLLDFPEDGSDVWNHDVMI